MLFNWIIKTTRLIQIDFFFSWELNRPIQSESAKNKTGFLLRCLRTFMWNSETDKKTAWKGGYMQTFKTKKTFKLFAKMCEQHF